MKFKVTLSTVFPVTTEIEVEVEEGENNADRACQLARKIMRNTLEYNNWNEDIRVDDWEVIGD